MKTGIKIIGVLVFSMFMAACATTGGIQVPEKYALNNQLEEVQWIWRTRIIDWEGVDNQSLIIQTSPGRYYLLVLTVSAYDLPFETNRIGISHSRSMIRAGLDRVVVFNGSHIRNDYPIEKIYKLKGAEQMRTIRDQLKNGKGIEPGDTAREKSMNRKNNTQI